MVPLHCQPPSLSSALCATALPASLPALGRCLLSSPLPCRREPLPRGAPALTQAAPPRPSLNASQGTAPDEWVSCVGAGARLTAVGSTPKRPKRHGTDKPLASRHPTLTGAHPRWGLARCHDGEPSCFSSLVLARSPAWPLPAHSWASLPLASPEQHACGPLRPTPPSPPLLPPARAAPTPAARAAWRRLTRTTRSLESTPLWRSATRASTPTASPSTGSAPLVPLRHCATASLCPCCLAPLRPCASICSQPPCSRSPRCVRDLCTGPAHPSARPCHRDLPLHAPRSHPTQARPHGHFRLPETQLHPWAQGHPL